MKTAISVRSWLCCETFPVNDYYGLRPICPDSGQVPSSRAHKANVSNEV